MYSCVKTTTDVLHPPSSLIEGERERGREGESGRGREGGGERGREKQRGVERGRRRDREEIKNKKGIQKTMQKSRSNDD